MTTNSCQNKLKLSYIDNEIQLVNNKKQQHYFHIKMSLMCRILYTNRLLCISLGHQNVRKLAVIL